MCKEKIRAFCYAYLKTHLPFLHFHLQDLAALLSCLADEDGLTDLQMLRACFLEPADAEDWNSLIKESHEIRARDNSKVLGMCQWMRLLEWYKLMYTFMLFCMMLLCTTWCTLSVPS
jgi:hypothetical protein